MTDFVSQSTLCLEHWFSCWAAVWAALSTWWPTACPLWLEPIPIRVVSTWPTCHHTAHLVPTLLSRGKTCRLLVTFGQGEDLDAATTNCFFLSAQRTAHWCCERRYLRPPDRRIGPADRQAQAFLTALAGALGLFWWLIAIVTTSRQQSVSVSPLMADALLWLGLLINLDGQYCPLPDAVGSVFTLALGQLALRE